MRSDPERSRPGEAARALIRTHAELVALGRRVAELVEQDRSFASLLMVDPLRALRLAGFELSSQMEDHVRARLIDVGLSEGAEALFERVSRAGAGLPWITAVRFVDRGRQGRSPS